MEEALSGSPTRFLGFRYGEELSRLYASSDVFVFPSVTDTLGQVVMESQASGLPVLVSDQGGPKEVVEDGRTGFVLSAEEPGAWVERLVPLCSNAAQRRVMGAEAHEAMQRYSMAASFERWWGVHEEAMATCPSHEPGKTGTNPPEMRRISRESVRL
jgi:glycosyltransferase involved in cell wall biosynthesis